MRRAGFSVALQETDQARLFSSLAEHLKTPLLHIARTAEVQQATTQAGSPAWSDHAAAIQLAAETSLQLLDYYLLSMRLRAEAGAGALLEPVSVSAILLDVAHDLSRLAERHGWDIELHLAGRYEPVLAHSAGLRAALGSLGHAVFESAPATEPAAKRRVITLGAHRSQSGIVAGVFSAEAGLSGEVLRQARRLYGRARHVSPAVHLGSGAGIFVADSLFQLMDSSVRVAHHHTQAGLAATFKGSRQLALV